MKSIFKTIFGILLIILGLATTPFLIGLYIIWIGWTYLKEA